MIDALHLEHVQRLPDVVGRAFLPGVGDGQEPLGAGAVVNVAELHGRVVLLRRVEAYRDDRVAMWQLRLERLHGCLSAEMTKEAQNEPGRDTELSFPVDQGAGNPLDDRREFDAAVGMRLGIEEDLCVAHALGGGAAEVFECQLVEVAVVDEHVARGVIDVEK